MRATVNNVLIYASVAALLAASVSNWVELSKIVPAYIIEVIPYLLGFLVLCVMLIDVARWRRLPIPGKYIVLLILYLGIFLMSAVVNKVDVGDLVGALVRFFGFLPYFMVGALVARERRAKRALGVVVLAIALCEVPLAVYQRLVMYSHLSTGDVVRGSFSSSAVLSLYMLAVSVYLVARVVVGDGRKTYLLAALLIFFPCTINETKGTVPLLILALGAMALLGVSRRKRFHVTAVIVPSMAVLLALYSLFYYIYWGHNIFTYYAEGGFMSSLDKQVDPREGHQDSRKKVGRVDAVRIAWDELKRNDKILFGFGPGNVTVFGIHPTRLQARSDSAKQEYYVNLGVRMNAIAFWLWNMGILGLALLVGFLVVVLKDSVRCATSLCGDKVLCAAWVGISVEALASLLYKHQLPHGILIVPHLLFSGMVAKYAQEAAIVSHQTRYNVQTSRSI